MVYAVAFAPVSEGKRLKKLGFAGVGGSDLAMSHSTHPLKDSKTLKEEERDKLFDVIKVGRE